MLEPTCRSVCLSGHSRQRVVLATITADTAPPRSVATTDHYGPVAILQRGTTTFAIPIAQLMQDRTGVYQDFAYLIIGALRALGIRARSVFATSELAPSTAQNSGAGLITAMLGLASGSGRITAESISIQPTTSWCATNTWCWAGGGTTRTSQRCAASSSVAGGTASRSASISIPSANDPMPSQTRQAAESLRDRLRLRPKITAKTVIAAQFAPCPKGTISTKPVTPKTIRSAQESGASA